jgi:outer membrane protein
MEKSDIFHGPVAPVIAMPGLHGRNLVRAFVATVLVCASCAHDPPMVYGFSGTSDQPYFPWNPPQKEIQKRANFKSASTDAAASAIPEEIRNRIRGLSLPDIITVALLNSKQTRQAWSQARAAAAQYGGKRTSYLPGISASVAADKQKNVAAGGKLSFESKVYSANASFNWLLFDWGGRIASVEETREALFAADWNHNSAIQNVILQVVQAFYTYFAAKALQASQKASVDEAKANFDAAEGRNKAGLGTIADVLQARTALSQSLLSLESISARIMTTRGSLATAMGLPANTAFDADLPDGVPPVDSVHKSIAEYLDSAMHRRPDISAAWAQAMEAEAHVRSVRAQGLPSVSSGGNVGDLFFEKMTKGNNTYDVSINLAVPVFSGFSRHYDVLAARAQADAARDNAQNVEDLAVLQVWTDFYNLESAGNMVHTSDDLLASATQNQRMASGRYSAGVGAILDLLTAQAGLENARAQQIEARAGWWVAAAQLTHDTGMLLPGSPVSGKMYNMAK